MAGRAQAVLAVVAALGLHGAALALIGQSPAPAQTGASAAGDGGADLVTIAPVSGELADLVAAWETPPQVDVTPAAPAPVAEAAPVQAQPVPPAPVLAPPELTSPELASPVPTSPVPPPAPTPDLAPLSADPPPAPPPRPDAKPKPRPASKPAPKPEPAPERPKAAEKAPEPAKPAPVPALQAAGSGGSGAAGQAGSATAGTADAAGMQDAIAAWGADIRARIERRKAYPRDARGATGVVSVVLTVTPQGQLAGVSIAASSGNAALDDAALKAVQKAGRLPRGPKGSDPGGHSFRFKLRFER